MDVTKVIDREIAHLQVKLEALQSARRALSGSQGAPKRRMTAAGRARIAAAAKKRWAEYRKQHPK
jgi:hypothetical protein